LINFSNLTQANESSMISPKNAEFIVMLGSFYIN